MQTFFCLKLIPFSCCYREERLFCHTFSVRAIVTLWRGGAWSADSWAKGDVKGVQVEIKEIRVWKTTLMSFSPTRNSSVFTLSCLPLETEAFGEGEICGRVRKQS